ncbi:MAG: hypothetical protein STSR0008_17830 [Ignavibacterium sp.]
MKIILATKNKGKLKEIQDIFKNMNFEIVSLLDFENNFEIIEDGNSFEENAKIKAKYVFDKLKLPTIADDSGLCCEQLNGSPGIYSARYSGENTTDENNNKKLLNELSKFLKPHKAKFVCSAVFYDGKNFICAEGELTGEIADEPKGENGFGYDPIFIADNYNVTNGELSLEEKNKISHRAKAFLKLKQLLLNKYNSI